MKRTKLTWEELKKIYESGMPYKEMFRRLGVKSIAHVSVIFKRELCPDRKMKNRRRNKILYLNRISRGNYRRRCRECGLIIFEKKRNATLCRKHGLNKERQKIHYRRDPERYKRRLKEFRYRKSEKIREAIFQLAEACGIDTKILVNTKRPRRYESQYLRDLLTEQSRLFELVLILSSELIGKRREK